MTDDEKNSDGVILWSLPPGDWSLDEREAHVWAALLEVSPEARARFAASLAPEELERANRFRFERDRDRFIAGRGLLRAILGRCLEIEPARVELSYGPGGKPALTG